MGVQSLGWEDSLEKSLAAPPVLLPGESHGQKSLVGYSLWGSKELDMTEVTEHARITTKYSRRELVSCLSRRRQS